MASIKAKQDDLRKLMKERRENLKEQKNKVDSPFANLGQLFCMICNVQIKSNGLWVSHVAGKIHKENALKKKKGTLESTSVKATPQNVEKSSEFKEPPSKKLKVEMKSNSSKPNELKSSGEKLSLIDEYSSSSSEEDEKTDVKKLPKEQLSASGNEPNNVLPKDFFDAAASNSVNVEAIPEAGTAANKAEALPEGFFDDPVLDAKARNIEYKDPVEEEWERYQKAIAEETNVSKTIIAEDLEESVLERDITQIDEQILQWQKIKELESLVDEVKSQVPPKDENMNVSGSSDDELDEDELLDWRTKSVAKR